MGAERVVIEEMDPEGFRCFELGGEKKYRIWVPDPSESGWR